MRRLEQRKVTSGFILGDPISGAPNGLQTNEVLSSREDTRHNLGLLGVLIQGRLLNQQPVQLLGKSNAVSQVILSALVHYHPTATVENLVTLKVEIIWHTGDYTAKSKGRAVERSTEDLEQEGHSFLSPDMVIKTNASTTGWRAVYQESERGDLCPCNARADSSFVGSADVCKEQPTFRKFYYQSP